MHLVFAKVGFSLAVGLFGGSLIVVELVAQLAEEASHWDDS